MASKKGEWAAERWAERYPERGNPIWLQKDWIVMARLERELKESFKPTWETYLNHEHPFFDGHSPGKLLANLGKFQTKPALVEEPKIDPLMDPKFRKSLDKNQQFQRDETMHRLKKKKFKPLVPEPKDRTVLRKLVKELKESMR